MDSFKSNSDKQVALRSNYCIPERKMLSFPVQVLEHTDTEWSVYISSHSFSKTDINVVKFNVEVSERRGVGGICVLFQQEPCENSEWYHNML
jgi:hypothetical protein